MVTTPDFRLVFFVWFRLMYLSKLELSLTWYLKVLDSGLKLSGFSLIRSAILISDEIGRTRSFTIR